MNDVNQTLPCPVSTLVTGAPEHTQRKGVAWVCPLQLILNDWYSTSHAHKRKHTPMRLSYHRRSYYLHEYQKLSPD